VAYTVYTQLFQFADNDYWRLWEIQGSFVPQTAAGHKIRPRNCRERDKFAPNFDPPVTKAFQLQGALSPDPDQGLCPWTQLEVPPPDPCVGARSALAMSPPKLKLWIGDWLTTGSVYCRVLYAHKMPVHSKIGALYIIRPDHDDEGHWTLPVCQAN